MGPRLTQQLMTGPIIVYPAYAARLAGQGGTGLARAGPPAACVRGKPNNCHLAGCDRALGRRPSRDGGKELTGFDQCCVGGVSATDPGSG